MKAFHSATVAAVVFTLAANAARAQDAARQPPAPAQQPARASTAEDVVPLKIVVTLSRYDGDKRTSSLPYTLSVNAPGTTTRASTATLRMGTQVPVASATTATASGASKEAAKPSASFTYRDVGTNIDVTVIRVDERFNLGISVSDSSVVEDKSKTGGIPSFRQFSIGNQVVLKDGQSAQFSTAPDKVTGEVVKVDVSLNIVK